MQPEVSYAIRIAAQSRINPIWAQRPNPRINRINKEQKLKIQNPSRNPNSNENGVITATARFTKHAAQRYQQRGNIPREVVDLYLQYASWTHSNGAKSYAFDKRSRRRLKAVLSRRDYCRCEKWLDRYIVVSGDGVIITIAHRTRRYRN